MTQTPKLRIFAASSASLLTDRAGHGEGLIAHALFSTLARRGHTVTVCTKLTDFATQPPYHVVEIGRASKRESIEPIAYARRVAEVFAAAGGSDAFDVVHWLFPQDGDELVYAPSHGVAYVVGPLLPDWPSNGRTRSPKAGDVVRAAVRPTLRRARRRALERADALLLSSPAAAAVLPAELRASALVLPFGVDESRFAATPVPVDGPILFFGKLERAKGVRELVEAFAIARHRVQAARLHLVGDGPERAWIVRRAAELGLGESLTQRGPVAHEHIPRELSEAALVCLPSHGEPYGMAVLESMAAGRAVVTTNAGGPRYLVTDGEGGRLVEPGDVPALAETLIELFEAPAMLARMGAFNRARFERELTLTRVAARLEAVYHEVATQRAAA